MANSKAYNDFYRDLDLIESTSPPRSSSIGYLFKIANKVQHQERLAMLALGATPRDAYYASWTAFQGVIDISVKPCPTIYQTTEARMIPRHPGVGKTGEEA